MKARFAAILLIVSMVVGSLCFYLGNLIYFPHGTTKYNNSKVYTEEEYKKAVDSAWSQGFNAGCKYIPFYDFTASTETENKDNDDYYDEDDDYDRKYCGIDSEPFDALNNALNYLDDAQDELDYGSKSEAEFNIFLAQEKIYDVIDLFAEYSYLVNFD